MQRGGFPVRTVVFGLFVIGTVYLLYLYNGTAGRLRDAEQTAERYRRAEETKVAELQETVKSKDELQEKCENDKHEFTNRLNSLNQQHKMLKSQYDEHEVEQMRLEQEAKRVKEAFEQVEAQRTQEYQQLKAEKELEITRLKDQLADAQRMNARLQTEITNLRAQVQSDQQQLQQHQSVISSMNTEIQGLKQRLDLANAQQKEGVLNFQQQQVQKLQEQHPRFQQSFDSAGHQQFLPGKQQGQLAGFAAVQNGVENMNMNGGGNHQGWPQLNQKSQGLQDDNDETLRHNLKDENQVTNQSNSILVSRKDSISLDAGTASPLDAEQVSVSKIKGLNETDDNDETLQHNLEDVKQVTNQSNSFVMRKNNSRSLDAGTASPLDAEQVSVSKIKGLNETDDNDETLQHKLEDVKQVTNQSNGIVMRKNNFRGLDAGTASPLDAEQVSVSKIKGLNEKGGAQIDVENQHHQMAPPVQKDKLIEGPDAPVNGNVDGRHFNEIGKNENHQVAAPLFKSDDKEKEADFLGVKDAKHQEPQPLGLKPLVQHNSQDEEGLQQRGGGLGRNEDEEEVDDAHNVLQQMPPVNPPRNFGQNPPVKRMEEEDQYDKYEDDGQDDNNPNRMNGNVQINHPVENAEEANYP